jgi:beta-galactosidase
LLSISYIFWNVHEPYPGVYDFDGQNDVFSFIRMAQQTGFVVILRPGPYGCAETEFGTKILILLDKMMPKLIK